MTTNKPTRLPWAIAGAALLGVAAMWASGRGAATSQRPTVEEARAVSRAQASAADSAADSEPGYWGEVDVEDITLRLPSGYVSLGDCESSFHPWVFDQTPNAEAAERQMAELGLTPAQRARLRPLLECDAQTCRVQPPDELVGALSPAVRAQIMRRLAMVAENEQLRYPFRRARRYGRWADMPWLRPTVRDMFARVAYQESGDDVVVDTSYACRALQEPAERIEFMEALKVRYGLAAHLRVDPSTPLEPLARWYSRRGNSAEVLSTLRTAQAGPRRVTLHDLLPPLARLRHDSFPRLDEPAFDCFWSALHFFDGADASTHLPGLEGFQMALRTQYQRVPRDELRYGDMLVFISNQGVPTHAVNVITPTLVFTKNGGSPRRPWAIMRLDDVRAQYPNVTDIQGYRLRSGA